MVKSCVACGRHFTPPPAVAGFADFCEPCFTKIRAGRCPVGPHRDAVNQPAGRFGPSPVVTCIVQGEPVPFSEAHPMDKPALPPRACCESERWGPHRASCEVHPGLHHDVDDAGPCVWGHDPLEPDDCVPCSVQAEVDQQEADKPGVSP